MVDKIRIGIKNGKIIDMYCPEIGDKKGSDLSNNEYVIVDNADGWFIGDSWNAKDKVSLFDSPNRLSKSPLELKIKDLESRILKLEKKIK